MSLSVLIMSKIFLWSYCMCFLFLLNWILSILGFTLFLSLEQGKAFEAVLMEYLPFIDLQLFLIFFTRNLFVCHVWKLCFDVATLQLFSKFRMQIYGIASYYAAVFCADKKFCPWINYVSSSKIVEKSLKLLIIVFCSHRS